MAIPTEESLQMVSEPAFLATIADKHDEDNGLEKLETQFQSFADETNKRFERLEERQNRFESKLKEFAESSKRVEEMLQQMISRRQQQPASSMKSQVPISQAGNMVEIDQSSVGGNLTSNTHILFPHESYDYGSVLIPSVTGTGLNNWYYPSTDPSDSKSPALPLPWVATVCATDRQSQANHVFDQCPQRDLPPFHEFSIPAGNFENEGLTLSENLESETNSCGNSIPSCDDDGFPFISTNGSSEAVTSGDEETVAMCQSDEGLLNDLVTDETGVDFKVTTSSWLPMFIEENESTRGSVLENCDDVPIGIEIEDEETAELKEDQVLDNYFHRDNAGTPVTIATLTNVVVLKAQTALNWKSVVSAKLQLFELRSKFHGAIELALREGLNETKQLEVIVHRSFKNTVVSLTKAVARVKLKKNDTEEEILFQVCNALIDFSAKYSFLNFQRRIFDKRERVVFQGDQVLVSVYFLMISWFALTHLDEQLIRWVAVICGYINYTEEAGEFKTLIISSVMLRATVTFIYALHDNKYVVADIGLPCGFPIGHGCRLKPTNFYYSKVHQCPLTFHAYKVYNHQTVRVLNASMLMCAKGDELKAFVHLGVEDYIIWISVLTIVSSQDGRSEIALNIYSEMRKGSCKMDKLSSTIIHRADTLLNTTEIGVFPSNDSGRLKKMIWKEMLIIFALAKASSLMPLIGVPIGEDRRIVKAIVKIMRSKVMQQLLFWSSITESMDDMFLAVVSTIVPNICTQYPNLLWVPKSIPYGDMSFPSYLVDLFLTLDSLWVIAFLFGGGSTNGLKEIGQTHSKTWLQITYLGHAYILFSQSCILLARSYDQKITKVIFGPGGKAIDDIILYHEANFQSGHVIMSQKEKENGYSILLVNIFSSNYCGAVLKLMRVEKLVEVLKCSPYMINQTKAKLADARIETDGVPALVIFSTQFDLVKNEFWKYKLKKVHWDKKHEVQGVIKKCILSSIISRLCNVGLWNHSRYPNYFGKICLWRLIFLASTLVLEGRVWHILVRLLFITLLFSVSGISLVETSVDKKFGNFVAVYFSSIVKWFSTVHFNVEDKVPLRGVECSDWASLRSRPQFRVNSTFSQLLLLVLKSFFSLLESLPRVIFSLSCN